MAAGRVCAKSGCGTIVQPDKYDNEVGSFCSEEHKLWGAVTEVQTAVWILTEIVQDWAKNENVYPPTPEDIELVLDPLRRSQYLLNGFAPESFTQG